MPQVETDSNSQSGFLADLLIIVPKAGKLYQEMNEEGQEYHRLATTTQQHAGVPPFPFILVRALEYMAQLTGPKFKERRVRQLRGTISIPGVPRAAVTHEGE